MRTITVKSGNGRKVEFKRDFGGDTLDSKIKSFGPELVATLFDQAATVRCQAAVRAALTTTDEAGNNKYTEEQAIQIGMKYIPNQPIERVHRKPRNPIDDLVAQVESGELTKDEMLKKIKERLAALK